MDRLFYLLNVGISGIKSIEKEIRLEFYKKTLNKDFDPDRYRIKAIYGENGSGKSAIITAMKILQDVMLNERYLSDSQNQNFLDEIINKNSRLFCIDCEFLVDLKSDKQVYKYNLEIGQNDEGVFEIKRESLQTKNGNYSSSKYTKISESRNGELVFINCNDKYRKQLEKTSYNLLTSKSFLPLFMRSRSEKNINDNKLMIHILLSSLFAIFMNIYIVEEDQHKLYFLKKKLRQYNWGNEKIESQLKDLEKSIRGFSGVNEKSIDKNLFDDYKKRVERLSQFIKLFKKDLVSIEIDAKENGDRYECDLNLNYGNYIVNKEFESTGIKKLIRLFDCFSSASEGGIVFIDEMDSNLNDVYLCKIIEYFMYYGTGQLCFTTHNLDPMNILKENKNSIEFLSSDNTLISWTSRGNASPENCYKNGMIEDSPFNIDATDFVGIFGD